LRELIAGSDVDHRRRAELDIHPSNCCKDELAGLVIECVRRLITEQDIGSFGDGTRDGHTLLFATGKLGRKVVKTIRESYERKSLLRVIRVDGNFADQRDIFENSKARDQVVELKYKTDMLTPIARQFCIVGPDEIVVTPRCAPTRRSIEAAEYVQKRRLADPEGPSRTTNSRS
jgi:hypothetical protein